VREKVNNSKKRVRWTVPLKQLKKRDIFLIYYHIWEGLCAKLYRRSRFLICEEMCDCVYQKCGNSIFLLTFFFVLTEYLLCFPEDMCDPCSVKIMIIGGQE